MSEPIPLSEKLYLLSIHPKKGGIISAALTASDFIIIGSLFLEMFQFRNIRFEKKRIELLNSRSENKIHEFILEKMARTDSNFKVGRWFNKFYFSLRFIRGRIQQNLSDKRIIRMHEKHFLFFKWKSPVIINQYVVYHLVDEIDRIIFKGPESDEDLFLILMLQPAGLMHRIFISKERRKEADRRIKEILSGSKTSSVNPETIEAFKAVANAIKAATTAHHVVV